MSYHKLTFKYISSNLGIAIGLVLIWRGLWYVLDGVDKFIFNNNPLITAVGGIFLGIIILYLPDKDLKELQKL